MKKTVPNTPLPAGERPREPLPAPSDWSFDLIDQYHRVIRDTARRFALDTYPNQLEIITAEQMMDAYASVGMPINYRHWSFGKEFVSNQRRYIRGEMGLAYEIVINSSPCISYLMEENSMTMQALVIAHAAYGHNSFFKGNYLFRMWTDAESILDYLVFAKEYIAKCEEKYGLGRVEEVLDSCHALQNYGVDRYRHPSKLSLAEELARTKESADYAQSQVNELWSTLPTKLSAAKEVVKRRFPVDPEENILYFIEKNSPTLAPWEREIVRIVRKIAQYFYPQRQTQVMNEGWATFWHHKILNTMYDEGHLSDGLMIEFMKSHTNVVYQPPVGSRAYGGFNPYALGFAMYTDIKRICEGGTWRGAESNPANFVPSDPHQLAEDHLWFPAIAGTNWLPVLHEAMHSYKDESFIGQFLSPKVIRDFHLFAILDDENEEELEVSAIHDDSGYQRIREALSKQYDLASREPNIQVWNVDTRGDRSLTLRHTRAGNRPLHDDADEVLRHVARLWGFNVQLESIGEDGGVKETHECAAPERNEDD